MTRFSLIVIGALTLFCAVIAYAQGPDAQTLTQTGEALGLSPDMAMWLGVLLLCVRGIAATISANVPDAKLGKAAPALNRLGGNVGHAKNAGMWLLGALFAGALLFAPAPAMAADCNFDHSVDGKVIRFAWPPAVQLPWRVVDTEVGFGGMTLVCGNVSAELRNAACAIPKVGGLLGGFCPKPPEDEAS